MRIIIYSSRSGGIVLRSSIMFVKALKYLTSHLDYFNNFLLEIKKSVRVAVGC